MLQVSSITHKTDDSDGWEHFTWELNWNGICNINTLCLLGMAAASSGSGGQLPPPYASSSGSRGTSSGTLPRGFKLDREFTLLPSREDRDRMKIQAEIYAMLTTMDCLEDMFASGYVEKSDVRAFCSFSLHSRRILSRCPRCFRTHFIVVTIARLNKCHEYTIAIDNVLYCAV